MTFLKILFLCIMGLILTSFAFISPAQAIENNKFGVHIIQDTDLDKAAEVINSNGGDWGYVTIVIQDDNRDAKKWQRFFDLCREKHLIPLVRLATHSQDNAWTIPQEQTIRDFYQTLSSLNWPVKNQYIIAFNEPNHSAEWGGTINPRQYAQILNLTVEIFHQNSNFKVLNAGLDQAAPNSRTTMDAARFLEEMSFEVPGIFDKLDGWASHSYPNHGFVGKPWESGKASVKGYDWELSYIKTLGATKNLPVFITETGWPYNDNNRKSKSDNGFYDKETAGEYLKQAFENVWLPDNKVMAITPFVLNYPYEPFNQFSWLSKEGDPVCNFDPIKGCSKKRGQPEQIESWEVVEFTFPNFYPSNSVFDGKITLRNRGQSIWGEKPFNLTATSSSELEVNNLILPENKLVKPGEKHSFNYTLKIKEVDGEAHYSWEGIPEKKIKVFKPWTLKETKTSWQSLLLQKFFNFWYNLR